jgi:LPXTG-motif cell wall-anchored protein
VRKSFVGLAAGMMLALGSLGFQAPAAAASDPITFTFTDGCGYLETTVTNNTAEPVRYQLATIISGFSFAMGPLDFTIAGGATTTHRWMLRFHHGVRASSPALAASVDHLWDSSKTGCSALWPQPLMQQDCGGKVLAMTREIPEASGMGRPRFAVNGKPGTPFTPSEPHVELIEGLHNGDVVSFLMPALSDGKELVTWYETKIEQCAGMPPVTVTLSCTDEEVNVKTVNTGAAERDLQIVYPVQKTITLAAGQAFDETFAVAAGAPILIFWGPEGFETGPDAAAAVGIYAKPQSCDAPPPAGGGQLPTTGTPTWLLASAGGLLLLLGAAVFALTRRRPEPIA